jgi:hypothetical protein
MELFPLVLQPTDAYLQRSGNTRKNASHGFRSPLLAALKRAMTFGRDRGTAYPVLPGELLDLVSQYVPLRHEFVGSRELHSLNGVTITEKRQVLSIGTQRATLLTHREQVTYNHCGIFGRYPISLCENPLVLELSNVKSGHIGVTSDRGLTVWCVYFYRCCFRHFSCTNLLRCNDSIGHASPKMLSSTQEVYIDPSSTTILVRLRWITPANNNGDIILSSQVNGQDIGGDMVLNTPLNDLVMYLDLVPGLDKMASARIVLT